MHTLICNLDPAWDFPHQVHRHCLDVFTDPDFAFWQVGAAVDPRNDPWGDWPRPIDPRYLPTELSEWRYLRRTVASVLIVHLPAREEAPLRALVEQLGTVLPVDHAPHRYVLTLPVTAIPAAVLAELVTTTWVDHLILLPATDPAHVWIYAMRLLSALFTNADLGAALDHYRHSRVVELDWDHGRLDAPLRDTVTQHWPPLARGLLNLAELLRGPGLATALPAWQDAVDTALRNVEDLRKTQLTHSDMPTGDNNPLEAVTYPWFFDRKLPARIDESVTAFYQQLDADLEQRYAQLNREQQQWRLHQISQEPAFLASMQAHRANTVGLSDQVRSILAEQHARLDKIRQSLIDEEQRLLETLRGDLTLETRRGAEVFGAVNRDYHRPQFPEDATLQQAQRNSAAAAQALASRRWFWGGLASVVGITLTPVLALRAPAWIAAGVWPYLQDDRSWAVDALWLVSFALGYLGCGLYQVYRHRRALKQALDVLKHRADAVHIRNHQVIDNTFHYQHQVMAMRRLVLVEDQINRLREDVRTALADLTALENTLKEPATTADPAAAAVDSGELSRKLLDQPPRAWLRRVLHDWPRDPMQEIAIRDQDFPQAGHLHTAYLRHCAYLTLTRYPTS